MDRNKLIEAGIDYDEGVERFGSKPEIYEKYLVKFFQGDMLSAMERQLEAKDIAAAFRTSHDLKGAAGNLSLSRFYADVCALTEMLRAQDPMLDYQRMLLRTKESYAAAEQAVKEAKQ